MAIVPLLIIPFLLFNLGLTGMLGGGAAGPWEDVLFSIPMMSGGSPMSAASWLCPPIAISV